MDDLAEEKRLMEAMRVYTTPSLLPLILLSSHTAGELRGSGTAIRVGETDFILSAAHVVSDDNINTLPIAHWMGQGEAFTMCLDRWRIYPKPRDIALYRLDNVLADSPVVPLQLERKLATSSMDLKSDFLFAQGWPERGSRFSPHLQTVFFKSLTLLGGEEPTLDPKYSVLDHVAVRFRADMSTFTVREHDSTSVLELDDGLFVEPYGMSGSLLWRLNWSPGDVTWTPEKARVVGLITNWDKESQSLVATRVEHLKANINQSLERIGLTRMR